MKEDIKQNLKKIVLRTIIVVFSIAIFMITVITVISTINSSSNLAFGKYKFYIMKTDSKASIATKGDLVIVKKHKPDEIQVGDNIVYGDNNEYFCETVVQTKKINIINKIVISENNGIKYQFDESEIEGKVIFNIHKVGSLITFLRTPIGIAFFFLCIICLVVVLRIFFINTKK